MAHALSVELETVTGVYDIPPEVYHADRRFLSQSGAKLLLPPSCPAKFAWWNEHPRPPKQEFDLGHAAHRLALGAGAELVTVPEHNWRTKRAQEAAALARDDGKIPMLLPEMAQVTEMVNALHRQVPGLFGPSGYAEQTLIWQDSWTGVWCKAMLDWSRAMDTGGRVVADYKTCNDASDEAVGKAIARWGYHLQAAWYLDGVGAVGGGGRIAFVFQEKTEPYAVNVVDLDEEALAIGRARARRAREIYRDCVESGQWPGYHKGAITRISLPRWAVYQHENEEW
jgi:hypothetical protein